MQMNDIVNEMIKLHKGGEKFFDNLDEQIKRKELLYELEGMTEGRSLIVSGRFGIYWQNFFNDPDTILVNGSLRKGEEIISLEPFKNYIEHKGFVFVDDSFYNGRTRDVIKAEIEKWGGELIKTVVAYDGSKKKDSSVESLYRYYDEVRK